MLDGMPPEAQERYGKMIESLRQESSKIEQENGIAPQAVAEAVGHALTAKRPKTRYLVGRDAKSRAPLAKLLPDRVMDALIDRALR